MGRIPENELEKLKREISLVDLVEAYGVKLEKKGKDFVGLCPFHSEKTPSFVVSPDKNLWHCMGACQEGGSVIDWIMKTKGATFREAVDILRDEPPDRLKAAERRTDPEPDFKQAKKDKEVLKDVCEYYQKTLKETPKALEYLIKRGLDHPELIDMFKLGFCDRSMSHKLPKKNSKDNSVRESLQKVGILRESGHEHFRGSLTIPVVDEYDNITEMYGRKINTHLREGTAYHLYLPGKHEGVFNVKFFRGCDEIILCESLIDALSFWCKGFYNVTAAYGTNGFTEDHMEAFKAYGIERVIVAFDNDDAGNKASYNIINKLAAKKIAAVRLEFPKGTDANELIVNDVDLGMLVGAATKKFKPSSVITGTEPKITESDNEISIVFKDRSWRVRGFDKNSSFDIMKINLLVKSDVGFYVDSLDLYNAKQRNAFIKYAASELAADEKSIKRESGRVMMKLEEKQDEKIKKTLEPDDDKYELSIDEKKEALEFLESNNLLDKILEDFNKCGVVGEEINKLTGYLAAVSRKLDKPLGIIIQSSSAAGKTWLMDSILSFMPEEEKLKYSAMTGQSLYYLGEKNLKHKILAIVEEEGAEKASYALKLLQSEGELSIASAGKDGTTGKLVTHEYHVEGPVMIFITTTSIDIDEELRNRCFILTVDESREQTEAIHKLQRERRTLEGLRLKYEKTGILKKHKNAQRLLKSLAVVNPYANQLTFLNDRTRTRRDNEKYLTLIESIALLHQYQREVKTMDTDDGKVDYITVTIKDIESSNKLAHVVLGRSLDDLPPQTRNFLSQVTRMVKDQCEKKGQEVEDYRFSRRLVCDYMKTGMTQVRVHLQRLVDEEYILIHRGTRGQSYVYELLYDGEVEENKLFLPGLLNVDTLKAEDKKQKLAGSKPKLAGVNEELAGVKRGQNGGVTDSKNKCKVPLLDALSGKLAGQPEKGI